MKNRHCVSEFWSPEVRDQRQLDDVLVRGISRVADCLLLLPSSHERDQHTAKSLVSLRKVIRNPIMGPPSDTN